MDGHAHANINRDLQDSREYFLRISKTCSNTQILQPAKLLNHHKLQQPQSIGINKI